MNLRACLLGGAVAMLAAACGSATDDGLLGPAEDAGAGAPGSSSGGDTAAGGSAGGAGGATSGGAPSGGTPSGGAPNGGSPSGGSPSGGTGATGGAGATAGTGNAPALVPCANSLDCAGDALGRTICATSLGLCVECASTPDCPQNADCTANRCVPYEPCQNSLGCTLGSVCDTNAGRCVSCVADADCTAPDVCLASACVTGCDSDNDCTPTGRLCDFASGACVECVTDAECAATEFCSTGSCQPDICQAGTSTCSPGGISACNARGDGFAPLTPCGARATCVDGSGGATCEPWVCTAGATECSDATTAITCAADGLSVLSSTDCTLSSQVCNAGSCSDLACSPGLDYCDQGTVRHCAADGLSSSLVDTCQASEYCDPADATCKALLCTPSAPACNGDVATTCNAAGTGYSAGGTDCAASGKTCAAGTCQDCPGGDGPLGDVRLVEVFVGQADYVVLENTNATCPVELSGLTLRASDTDASIDLTIGAFTLQPGATALVGESGTTTGADTVTSGLIDLNYTAGFVLLCAGACTTAGTPTVVDAMAYWNGTTQPPALPSPVTFSPIQGINSSNGTTTSFIRTAITGTYPDFAPSDWTTGAATRPDSASSSCPATQPTGLCTSFGAVCIYGAVTCTCSLSAIWSCN